MAATSQKDDDLSMEEILQSIRKIISDDDENETPTDAGETDMAGNTKNDDIEATGSDVLELTDTMEEVVEEEEAPVEAVDILAEIDDALDTPAEEAPAEAVVEKPVATPAPAAAKKAAPTEETPLDDAGKLLSDNAATASAASLRKVVDTHKSANPSPGFRSGTSVEELVLESLKPMLKDWLDNNLPSMVERIVEREIRKLVD